MNRGFYVIMAAQFFSALADNALLIASIALLRDLHSPAQYEPLLKLFFTVSYVALAAFVGADPEIRLRPDRLAAPLPAGGPREHWMRAALSTDPDGRTVVTPFPDQDSSLVGVFARADALLRRRAGTPAAAKGDIVDVLPLRRG